MKFDFVEIGTSCFDTIIERWTGPGRGISVEPAGEYLDMLPDPPGVIKVCAAISNYDGTAPFFYIPKSELLAHRLPQWIAGCNCMGRPHPTALSFLQHQGLDELLCETEVPVMSPETLFDSHEITEVGYLKIDTEGHDTVILKAWLDACEKREIVIPERIAFEDNELSDEQALGNLLRRLLRLNYRLERGESDIEAILRKPDAMSSVFADIYHRHAWNGRQSVSGPGADLEETENIRRELPDALSRLEVKSLLDAPCGDWNWMQRVDLGGVRYHGIDIVSDLIQSNRLYFSRPGVTFGHADITTNDLSGYEAILCRECLVHLSNAEVLKALGNILKSGAKWLLATHFPNTTGNADTLTGGWRPTNLTLAPFHFPEPEGMFLEECPVNEYKDKSIAFWNLEKVRGRGLKWTV